MQLLKPGTYSKKWSHSYLLIVWTLCHVSLDSSFLWARAITRKPCLVYSSRTHSKSTGTLKRSSLELLKLFILQLNYTRNKTSLFLYLFPAYTSWQSLQGHLSCKHPFSSPLELLLLHTYVAELKKMETGAQFQFRNWSVSYRKEGRKRVTSTYIKKKEVHA